MSGKPTLDLGAKPKRERGPVNEADSEGPVLKAVGQLLSAHPRVAIAIRINNGMAYSQIGAPVWFNKLIKGAGVLTDYVLILQSGKPGVIECKRPDWSGVSRGTGKTAIREQAQKALINQVIALGGVGGFVRSADEALRIINDGERW